MQTNENLHRTTSYSQSKLEEQLDWLTVDHDDLQRDLLEQTATPKYHPSMSMIDQWENEMIVRIRQTAVLARRALLDALDQHVVNVRKKMAALTPILHHVRTGLQPFNSTDLDDWAKLLRELKKRPKYPIIIEKTNDVDRLIIDLRELKEKTLDFRPTHSFISVIHPSATTIIQEYERSPKMRRAQPSVLKDSKSTSTSRSSRDSHFLHIE